MHSNDIDGLVAREKQFNVKLIDTSASCSSFNYFSYITNSMYELRSKLCTIPPSDFDRLRIDQ